MCRVFLLSTRVSVSTCHKELLCAGGENHTGAAPLVILSTAEYLFSLGLVVHAGPGLLPGARRPFLDGLPAN